MTRWFGSLSGTLRGGLFMIGSAAAFAVMMALVRLVSAEIHPFQAAFFRNAIGLALMLPWLARAGLGTLKTGRLSMHLLRSAAGLSAMLSLFYALGHVPLAQVTALTFAAPLFATIGAAVILHEKVRLRRWTAVIVGMIGVLIIVRPGSAPVSMGAVSALASAVFIATAMLTIKSLSRTEHPNAVVIIMGLLMTPLSLPPALFVWITPPAHVWPWLLLMGVAATIGQLCLTRALAAADASAVVPFDYCRLLFAAALGYALFDERPDAWTWTGGAVIIAATLYLAHRERRRRTPTPPAAQAGHT